ncbi:MAG TPA: hypothetical protein VFA65_08635 [Bryobacteraceae bacterium]|nr:hypothetical protein [Bryobacteraceae bacterium]
MHRSRRLRIFVTFLLVLLAAVPSMAQTDISDLDATAAVTRGQQISAAVSTVTSIAISPLLGVCVLGIWNYFRTQPAQRAHLPFYNFPAFWIPVGILLILIFFKDTVGGFTPLIKKPLDAIEVLLLNKAALVVIGFPVLFHQIESIVGANSFRGLFSAWFSAWQPVVYASTGAPPGFVDTASHITLTVLALLGGSVALIVVWLVGHSIDVLLLLSPFPFLDVLLKGFKIAVFAVLVGTSLMSRTAGLALSLVVILICALCAGWTFRLSLFGSVFAWDLLRTMILGLKRRPDAEKGIRCFSVGRRMRIRKRTFGRLVSTPEGKLEFCYRRLGFGPVRHVALPDGIQYEIGRGLLQPSLIAREEKNGKHRILFRMLPGYLGSEDLLRSQLGVQKISDIRLPSGLRAFWQWLNDSGEQEIQNESPAT